MNPQNPFSQLALRVQRGEPSAARRYREEMKPEIECMVRRALDLDGEAVSDWDEKILGEVERVLQRSHGSLARDSACLPAVIAERLCDRMIDRLQAQGRARNPAPAFAGRETVLC
jgi:hypothetical protein